MQKYTQHSNRTHTAACKQSVHSAPRHTVFAGKGGQCTVLVTSGLAVLFHVHVRQHV